MGDQKEDIWGSFNRRSAESTATPTVSIAGGFRHIRRDFAQRSVKHCRISQYLETWREPGPTQWVSQSRINREPIADFIDIFED